MARRKLGELGKGTIGTIVGITNATHEFSKRLLEMGMIEGSRIEIVHEAPFGGDPIAIRVRGAIFALRRGEANLIEVEL